jgi:hypothetical protein
MNSLNAANVARKGERQPDVGVFVSLLGLHGSFACLLQMTRHLPKEL